MTKTDVSIICAGFGGQGIMLLGKILASAGMKKGLNVTWLPSYGAEVRGGTAHSMVRLSSGNISSPAVPRPDIAVIMNGPALAKFEKRMTSGGLMVINTSISDKLPSRKDLKVIAAPLTEEAITLGNIRVANVIAAGIIAGCSGMFDRALLEETIKDMGKGYEKLVPVNMKALQRGLEIARKEKKW